MNSHRIRSEKNGCICLRISTQCSDVFTVVVIINTHELLSSSFSPSVLVELKLPSNVWHLRDLHFLFPSSFQMERTDLRIL